MSRKYHRYVGGKKNRLAEPKQVEMWIRPKSTEKPNKINMSEGVLVMSRLGGPTPVHCCPDVPPWEWCVHQTCYT